MPALREIIYRSTAAKGLDEVELASLLDDARARNAELDITGMLLFADGDFVQVIEGPPEAVGALYETIANDARHTDCRLLLDREIERRSFPDWRMGYRLLERPSDGEVMEALWEDLSNVAMGVGRRILGEFIRFHG